MSAPTESPRTTAGKSGTGRLAGPLARYGTVLRLPGAAKFSGAAFVARFPMSMFGIGIVLLVSETTGSYGLAGAVSAAALVAAAVAAPVQARAADRWGQRRVLIPLVALHVSALSVFLFAAWTDAPRGLLVASAAISGGALPQVGSFVRARWAALVGGTPALQPAYAWESVLDELIFIGGPVLATALATGVHPLSALGLTLVITTVGGLALASLRSSEPPVKVVNTHEQRDKLNLAALIEVSAAFVFLGAVFGTIEVGAVGFTDEVGQPSAAGWVLATWALGSMLAGLAYGAIAWQGRPAVRFVAAMLMLAITMSLTVLATSPLGLAALLLPAGLAISPTLITGMSMIEQASPASRLTEALAWTSTALAIGVAIGAATSGALIDARGATAALGSAAIYALLGTLAALPMLAQKHTSATAPVAEFLSKSDGS